MREVNHNPGLCFFRLQPFDTIHDMNNLSSWCIVQMRAWMGWFPSKCSFKIQEPVICTEAANSWERIASIEMQMDDFWLLHHRFAERRPVTAGSCLAALFVYGLLETGFFTRVTLSVCTCFGCLYWYQVYLQKSQSGVHPKRKLGWRLTAAWCWWDMCT